MIEVTMDRRQFLKTAGLGAAALALPGIDAFAEKEVPKKFCPPDRKLRIACVGAGGNGRPS